VRARARAADPDVALTEPEPARRGRSAGVRVLGGLSALLLGGAVAARLVTPSAEALDRRDAELIGTAARALEDDAKRLSRVAEAVQRSPELAAIVDAGGTEVRPGRLFGLLSRALPRGAGWGAVFFDVSGRAVAWAGDAGEFESERVGPGTGFLASFHVTRFSIVYRSPRVVATERRGVLALSRRYPTGILRPELLEVLRVPGGPTRLKVRARAASRPDRLVALFVEPAPERLRGEELTRARARPLSLALAGSSLALGFVAHAPAAGIAAARAALLLGAPRAEAGVWGILDGASRNDLGLVATPADLLLTGISALLLFRLLARALPPFRTRSIAARAAFLALGVVLTFPPWFLARAAGVERPDLFDQMSLVPESAALFFAESGGAALFTAFLGAAALALSLALPLLPQRRPLAAAGLLLLALSMRAGAEPPALPLAAAGTFLVACALSRRAREGGQDLLGRAATAVFFLGGAVLAGASGLVDGKLRRLDEALLRAERMDRADRLGYEREQAQRFSERIAAPDARPWLPAGPRTLTTDLARALWVRGADDEFPEEGDLLAIREAGEVVSSFGVLRPGMRGTSFRAELPLPDLTATWTHVAYPREADRDALLVAAVARDLPGRVIVERIEFDAAGRAVGTRGERVDLPARVLADAQRNGTAAGELATPEGLRRLRVRSARPGYVGYAAPSDSRPFTFGVAVAAGETSLPVLLAALLAFSGMRGPKRRRVRGPLLETFRARLVLLVLVFGALPLAGSIAVVQIALQRHTLQETRRRARVLLSEARRSFADPETVPGPPDLNRAAAVIGSDLLLYRNGRLVAASRALPVAAEIAGERLTAGVSEALAEGRGEAAPLAHRPYPGGPRIVEAAEPLTADGEDALAVVVAEDEAGRVAVDALVLFTVAVALGAFGLGGRSALALSRPVEDLIDGAEKIGSGEDVPPIERPRTADLARLVEAFETMGSRVRERTESLARERAAAVELFANLTAAVILFRERDGAVLLANPAADRILPGSDVAARLAPGAWAPLRAALAEGRRRRAPYDTRITVAEGGVDRVFRVVVAPLPPDENEERSLLLLEDLTDFIRADRLTAWVDAARAIAHDVKNPLTPIRLASERLLRLGVKGETPSGGILASTAASILRQVEILTERIGRLARFSDPSALATTRFDAGSTKALLDEVVSDYTAHETIALAVDVARDLPPFLADRALLSDVLSNLVLNAVEALGERPGRIVLSAASAPLPGGGRGVRLACDDDGPGVSEEERRKLFDPTFSTKSRGSGMGLAAARRAVERHRGAVFAEPRPGGGLRVGFTLPAMIDAR
jgi:signal transduction histidine kinase